MTQMKDPKGPVKAYKSPEELAKKHNVPLSAIMNQVKIGTKIEGEHTTSKSGARITALQHVDELPDYYTKLKKVEKIKEGSLHQWFKGSKSKEGKPGWVQSDGSPCANEPGETKTPKCFSSSKLSSMSKGQISSAVRRKREQDPGQQQKTGAAKPTYVSTDSKKKMNKEEFLPEEDIKGKSSGKKDACYHKVKARFKVWPSAYGSGALVKCRKAGAKNWGTKSEETTPEEQYKKDTKYCLLCKKNETREECSWGPTMWDKYTINKFDISNESKIHEDHKEIASGKKKDEEGYMARVEFDQIERAVNILRKHIKKGDQQIPSWVQSKITRAADFIDTAADYMQSDEDVSEACWAGYKQVGMKKKGKKKVPNCVPANEDTYKTFSEFMQIAEEWKPLPKEKMISKMQEKDRVRTLSQRNPSDTRISKKEPISKVKEKSRVDREVKLERQSNMMKLALKNPEGYRSKGDQSLPRKKSISESSPAWQKKEGKNPEGGLNRKGIESYRRENPGSKLSMAVTTKPSKLDPDSKPAKRRKSFCARMGGVEGPMKDEKGRPTRKALALRKWNC